MNNNFCELLKCLVDSVNVFLLNKIMFINLFDIFEKMCWQIYMGKNIL